MELKKSITKTVLCWCRGCNHMWLMDYLKVLQIYVPKTCAILNFKIVAMNVEESNSASSFKWHGVNKLLVRVPSFPSW